MFVVVQTKIGTNLTIDNKPKSLTKYQKIKLNNDLIIFSYSGSLMALIHMWKYPLVFACDGYANAKSTIYNITDGDISRNSIVSVNCHQWVI